MEDPFAFFSKFMAIAAFILITFAAFVLVATRLKKNKPHKFRPEQLCILRITGQKVLILGTVYHVSRNKWAYAVMYKDQLDKLQQAEIPEAQLSSQ